LPEAAAALSASPENGRTREEKDGALAPTIGNPRRFVGYCITAVIREAETAVYRATDERFGREVAIHVLTPAESHKEAAAHFFTEAATVARLRHPTLVRAMDVGKSGRQLFFVEEHVRSESLADKLARLERKRLGEGEALRLVRQLALALQALADAGLCHRWLRPDKILLTESGNVKLRGAGQARHLRFSTWREALCESAAWVAPEKIREDSHLDIRADLYSLGCVWFYALFGQPPFSAAVAESALESHLSALPPSPRERDPRLSAATSQIILWLLKKEREARPSAPRDLLAHLERHPLWEGKMAADISTHQVKERE